MIPFNVIYATLKGQASEHQYQDFVKVVDAEECLIAIVADGLGSAKSSARGSQLICDIISEWANNINWDIHDFTELLNTSVMEWYRRLELKGIDTRQCSTTCSLVAINKNNNHIYLCNIGDSPIFYRIDNEKACAICSEKEFLNETHCIGPITIPQFNIVELSFKKTMAFIVATDGVGDELVLETIDSLFDYFIHKYSMINKKKRNSVLKDELKEAMGDKNGDDKSIIFGWTCQM